MQEFGLCDKPHPIKEPAYIDEEKQNIEDWIAKVENKNQILIDFYAIDNCVEILRPNGETESSCDGMICYKDVFNLDNIIFIELKNRMSKGWVKKGTEQIKITLEIFIKNNNIGKFTLKVAYICNRQHPSANNSSVAEIQKFKDETASLLNTNGLNSKGLNLKIDLKVIVE